MLKNSIFSLLFVFFNIVFQRQDVFGVEWGDNGLSRLFFQFQSGIACHGGTLAGYFRMFAKCLRGGGFRDFFRGKFGKHVQHQFFVRHIVTQILFLQTFELLVLFGGFPRPRLVDNVGEGGELHSFFQAVTLPFVGEVFAYLNAFQALVNPVVGIAEALLVSHGLLDGQFRVLHLVEALFRHLRHPEFEGFCLR